MSKSTKETVMDREELVNEISDGRICTIHFVKRDGTIRKLTGRTGVKKALRGGEKGYDDKAKNIVTLYDVRNQGYRSIKADSILEVHSHGKVIKPK